jgi:hypothetical protein
VQFFWAYNWNIDYKGNLWITDKVKHSIYYISKEEESFNAVFKVSGREYVKGSLNGNIAMGLFNTPSSLALYDNNSTERRLADNIKPIIMHAKFFRKMDRATQLLKERCERWVAQENYTLCGEKIPETFEELTFTPEEMERLTKVERHKLEDDAYLRYSRVDFRRVKMVSFANISDYKTFQHDPTIDPRLVYIADRDNHCIRRIIIK